MSATGQSSGDFISGLQDAIRQNPVSSALIGVGVLWMFAGGNRITAAAALFPTAARATASGVASGLERSADAVGAAGEGLKSMAERVTESLRDTVSTAAAAAGDTATHGFETLKDAAKDSTSMATTAVTKQSGVAEGISGVLKENLKETFERQPLLLGAIGLAIGAGMAAAAPTTQIETQVAGDAADAVKAQVKDFTSAQVGDLSKRAERAFEAVKEEAAAQGLTPQAAKEGAAAIGGKLKKVAKAARGSSSS